MNTDLNRFLPYMLNQASELISAQFQPTYKDRYGMLRTEWRVLFHLGHRGEMTAKQICAQAMLHKTKVSRAVHALKAKGYLNRQTSPDDRRTELLTLTSSGRRVFRELSDAAANFENDLAAKLTAQEVHQLRCTLDKLIKLGAPPAPK